MIATAPERTRHAEPVMGTVVSFDIRGDASGLDAAIARLHAIDAEYSLWKPASALSRMRSGEDVRPDRIGEVIGLCRTARELTGGAFDPWALPGGFDPTGLVKGWAAREALRELGAADAAMVNAGGDIALSGRTWTIGVRDPLDARRLLYALPATGAVATSGAYERGDHVRDPRTGERPRALSATVTGPDLALADALATALLVADHDVLEALAALDGYEGLLVMPGGVLCATAGFGG